MEVQVELIEGEIYLKPLFAWPIPVAGGETYPAMWEPVPDPNAPKQLRITVKGQPGPTTAPPSKADSGADSGTDSA